MTSINSSPLIHQLVMCANLFVQKDGRWLMLKRSPKKTFAPNFVHPIGGKLEQNEDPLSGAKRELFEEAGIIATNIRLGAVILEVVPHKELPVNWLIFHFVGDYKSGETRTTDEGELIWMNPEEILTAQLYPSVQATITLILDPQQEPVFAKFEYDGEDDNSFVVYRHQTLPGKVKKPFNPKREMNQEHFRKFHECLEKVDPQVLGYDIEAKK